MESSKLGTLTMAILCSNICAESPLINFKGSSLKRRASKKTAARIGVASVLTAAALVGTGLASQAPALASCNFLHVNVEADITSTSFEYGTKGYIYVNTQTTLSNLHNTIGRTYALIDSSGLDDVEFGWADKIQTDNGHTYTTPIPASDYMINGVTATAHALTSYTLTYNTDVRFRIENLGDNEIFRYVIDGQTTPIGYSPTMPFNRGFPLTNSEHYNTCDSLWTDMHSLSYQYNLTPTWYSWSITQCFANDSTDGWYLHLVSATEIQVNQSSTNGWGNGCVFH